MVFLDVVYNHFGPEGNYLHIYAKSFFTERHQTPWGAAINFDDPKSRTVRDFFIHNALYWLEEYHLDGLRIDAAHAIRDDSQPDILEELAQEVLRGPGAKRHVHLVLENDHNAVKYLIRDAHGAPTLFTAQWNDDIHHSLHCLVTGESAGYYGDYADRPAYFLGKCLVEGFAYQGEPSKYRSGASRGEPSKDLPPTAFVSFLQNHDQVGNRAFGDRITVLAEGRALRVAATILLMAPSPPLIFMAEELGCLQPFLFFCDFSSDLAASVTEGRRREFAKFPEFKDPSARKRIPDPNDVATFDSSRIDWNSLEEASHQKWLSYYRKLLGLRHRQIVPRLKGIRERKSDFGLVHGNVLKARWTLGDGSQLSLVANLAGQTGPPVDLPEGSMLVETEEGRARRQTLDGIPPWYAAWFLQLNRGEKK
jgi:maltooligosyltrehalose trehalohydrolase